MAKQKENVRFFRQKGLAVALMILGMSFVSHLWAYNDPPYYLFPYTADETDNPPLYYTKVCEPGRTSEQDASYVVLGVFYPRTYQVVAQNFTGDLVIPETIDGLPVRKIMPGGFLLCSGLKSVSIPSTMREIGERAFAWCTALTNVVFAEGTTFIGRNAFSNCTSLASITLPASLSRLEENCFARCESLTNVTFCGNAPRLTEAARGTGIPYLGEKLSSFNGLSERFKVYIYTDTYGWKAPYTRGVPEKWPVDFGFMEAYETVPKTRPPRGLSITIAQE